MKLSDEERRALASALKRLTVREQPQTQGEQGVKPTADDMQVLVGLFNRMMLQEARASVALDNDSRYCTVAGRECPECHRVYNMDLPACSWCGAEAESKP